MAYTLVPLPYAYNALEPFIDGRTMEIHHGKHHAAYINNLNTALEQAPALQGLSAEALIADLSKVPESIRTAVRNNGGGHVNHSLFWSLLKPGGSKPSGALADAITRDFGSLEALQEAFGKAALGRFGSGWAWLSADSKGKLCISSTPNQDSPTMKGVAECNGTPVLALDVWEHAYYLNYQNRRADYVKAFWSIVNWDKAAALYTASKS